MIEACMDATANSQSQQTVTVTSTDQQLLRIPLVTVPQVTSLFDVTSTFSTFLVLFVTNSSD